MSGSRSRQSPLSLFCRHRRMEWKRSEQEETAEFENPAKQGPPPLLCLSVCLSVWRCCCTKFARYCSGRSHDSAPVASSSSSDGLVTMMADFPPPPTLPRPHFPMARAGGQKGKTISIKLCIITITISPVAWREEGERKGRWK